MHVTKSRCTPASETGKRPEHLLQGAGRGEGLAQSNSLHVFLCLHTSHSHAGEVKLTFEPLTGRLAHADLALALHQRVEGWRWAASAAGGHRGSFGREDRHGGHRRGGWWRWGRGGRWPALGLVAELGEGGWYALVVAGGAQEVVEDLQNGADVSPGTPIAVLAVRMQSA